MANDAMMRYEALILAVPHITADESSALESQLHEFISKHNGETISFDRWGKFRLAYEVRKNEYGVYYLTRFDLPAESLRKMLDSLRDFFAIKYNELVMRHMITQLDKDASLEYKRPESLEEAPRREFDPYKRGGRSGAPRRDGRRFERSEEAYGDSAAAEFEMDNGSDKDSQA